MKIFSIAIACIFFLSSSQAQLNINTGLSQDFSFNQLNKIASLSKPYRDSIAVVLKKIDFSKFSLNIESGVKMPKSTVSKFRSVMKDVYSLVVDVFENPLLADQSQQKMNSLLMRMEIVSDEIGYEIDKATIINEYKNAEYDSKKEKKEAKKDMKQQLADLKKEHEEDIKDRKEMAED